MKKNILFTVAAALVIASCGTSKTSCDAYSLVKNSSFSISTTSRDTLYLLQDEPMARTLKNMWDNGTYGTEGEKVTVLLVDRVYFEGNLLPRVTKPTTASN
jgi:hypothetical protein